VLPLALTALPAPAATVAAALAHAAGMVVLRWLFFAEAEHVVGLYYGRR
jgi:DMSO reductase anchor subunit